MVEKFYRFTGKSTRVKDSTDCRFACNLSLEQSLASASLMIKKVRFTTAIAVGIVVLVTILLVLNWKTLSNAAAAGECRELISRSQSKRSNDDYKGAMADLREAIGYARKLPNNELALSEALQTLAEVYMDLGLFGKAQPYLTEALALREQRVLSQPGLLEVSLGIKPSYAGSDGRRCETLKSLALCHFFAGDYDKSEAMFALSDQNDKSAKDQRQRDGSRKLSGLFFADGEPEWTHRHKAAFMAASSGNFDKAHNFLKQSLKTWFSTYLVRDSAASDMAARAVIYEREKRRDAAQAWYQAYCIWVAPAGRFELRHKVNRSAMEDKIIPLSASDTKAMPLWAIALDSAKGVRTLEHAMVLTLLADEYINMKDLDVGSRLLAEALKIERESGNTSARFVDELATLATLRKIAGLQGNEERSFELQDQIKTARTSLRSLDR